MDSTANKPVDSAWWSVQKLKQFCTGASAELSFPLSDHCFYPVGMQIDLVDAIRIISGVCFLPLIKGKASMLFDAFDLSGQEL